MKKQILWGIVKILAACAALFAGACAAALSEWLHPWVSAACLWGLYPLFGAWLAYLLTVHGINNYIAWLPAMGMLPVGFLCVWGYVPHMGAVLVSALLGIVGAATGDTKNRFERGTRK